MIYGDTKVNDVAVIYLNTSKSLKARFFTYVVWKVAKNGNESEKKILFSS